MGEITPFQRQVLDAASQKEAEERENKRQEMQQQGSGGGSPGPARQPNPRAGGVGPNKGGSDLGQHETVRYVNRQEYPDHPVHDEEPDDLSDE